MIDLKQKYQEEIEAYVLGNLSPEAKRTFEEKIEMNKELANDVRLEKAMKASLGDKSRNEFKKVLKEVIHENRNNPTEQGAEKILFPSAESASLWPRWAAAAAILILLGAGLWLWSGKSNDVGETLYAEHFESYPGYTANRSEDYVQGMQEAMELYNAGAFDQAAQLFSELSPKHPNRSDVHLYAGVSYMEINDFPKSLKFLRKVGKKDLLYDQAQWYKALVFIKNKEFVKAKPILKSLSTKSGNLGKKANELLKELQG